MYVYYIFIVHLPVEGLLDFFSLPVYCEWAAMNTAEQAVPEHAMQAVNAAGMPMSHNSDQHGMINLRVQWQH